MNSLIQRKCLLVIAMLAIVNFVLTATSVNAANVVMNGDFSSNAALVSNYPGYRGGLNPAEIDNWTSLGTTGINGDSTGIAQPFAPADHGAVTDFVFLQNSGAVVTQIMSLTANTTYDISFLAANRNGNTLASGRVLVADDSATYYDSGFNIWGTAGFQAVATQFVTGASFDGAVVLTLSNDSLPGDNTVDYSNVVIEAVPEPTSLALLGMGSVLLLRRRRQV
jgi:hypothetical protein